MQRLASWSVWLTLVGAVLVGCGTQSIPRVAANGTTITIPVPDGFGAGFGRVLNQHLSTLPYGPVDPATLSIEISDPPSGLEDFQRGELLFALRFTSDPSSGLLTYLPVRYITRVEIDEASSAGMPATGESSAFEGTPPATGQVVALVDIPRQLGAGTYYIFAERWKRRDDPDPEVRWTFENVPPKINTPQVDWLAWFGTVPFYGTPSPSYGMPIRIVESSFGGSLFNDAAAGGFDKLVNYSWRNFAADLERLVPRPKLKIWTKNAFPPQGAPAIPAAWEFTLQYPAGKIEVLGAELGSLHRSGAMVSVSADPGSPTDCGSTGTAKVSGIDPDQRSAWVSVVYRLKDFAACGRAGPSDFTMVAGSLKAYDADGTEIENPTGYLTVDTNYSFQ